MDVTTPLRHAVLEDRLRDCHDSLHIAKVQSTHSSAYRTLENFTKAFRLLWQEYKEKRTENIGIELKMFTHYIDSFLSLPKVKSKEDSVMALIADDFRTYSLMMSSNANIHEFDLTY